VVGVDGPPLLAIHAGVLTVLLCVGVVVVSVLLWVSVVVHRCFRVRGPDSNDVPTSRLGSDTSSRRQRPPLDNLLREADCARSARISALGILCILL
jgi:hypothetical protein